jgi:3-oxoacyl-[acyl-carrier protein] reductase
MPAIRDRCLLVTGAGSRIGIGRAVALAAARAGAAVVANDVVEADLSETVDEVRAHGGQITGLVGDVADLPAVEELVAAAESLYGGVDVLVNNAGIAKKVPFHEMTREQFDRTLSVNLGGTWNCCRAAIPGMLERGGGVIVNVSSIMGSPWGWAEHVHYNASKAAIEGLTRGLAVEYGPRRIRVNAVAPGFVRTAQSTDPDHSVGPEGLAVASEYVPLRRVGDPTDIVEVILFLASDAARYITGQTLLVDGGLSLGDLGKAFEDPARSALSGAET